MKRLSTTPSGRRSHHRGVRLSRKARRRGPALLAVAAVFALLAAACGGSSGSSVKSNAAKGTSETAAPTQGGTLAVGVPTAWHPLDPLKLDTAVDDDIGLAVFAPLLKLGPGGSLSPDLATSYKAENSNKTFVLQLRKGVTFQDRTPFNSSAVVFNLERVFKPSDGCACASGLTPVTSVVAHGAYSVTITLVRPDAGLPNLLAGPVGMMVSPTAVKKEGANFGNHPVGAGPFKYQSQVAGNSITFVKWNGYWDKPEPYLSGVTFKVLSNTNSLFASLQSGAIQTDTALSPTQISTATSSGLTVTSLGGLGTYFVGFQTKAAPFDNVLAREAVSYATDPTQIDEAIANGKYGVIESPWTTQSWAYPGAHVTGYSGYDLAKAKQLVKQLGGLSFTFQTSNDPAGLALAEALQSQWSAAGIKVKISSPSTLAAITIAAKGTFQATLWLWQGSYDPDGNVSGFFKCGSPGNFMRLCDPKVDSLLAAEQAGTSQAARKPIFAQLAVQLAKDDPYAPLFANDFWRGSATTVHGIPSLANSWVELAGAWRS